MTDIAKCGDDECPSRMKCRRFTAPSDTVAQDFVVTDRDDGAERCDYFWPNRR